MRICNLLWNNNIKAEYSFSSHNKMKNNIEYALNNNIQYIIIIGENEIK